MQYNSLIISQKKKMVMVLFMGMTVGSMALCALGDNSIPGMMVTSMALCVIFTASFPYISHFTGRETEAYRDKSHRALLPPLWCPPLIPVSRDSAEKNSTTCTVPDPTSKILIPMRGSHFLFRRMDFTHLYSVPPKPEDDGSQAMNQNMNMGRR